MTERKATRIKRHVTDFVERVAEKQHLTPENKEALLDKSLKNVKKVEGVDATPQQIATAVARVTCDGMHCIIRIQGVEKTKVPLKVVTAVRKELGIQRSTEEDFLPMQAKALGLPKEVVQCAKRIFEHSDEITTPGTDPRINTALALHIALHIVPEEQSSISINKETFDKLDAYNKAAPKPHVTRKDFKEKLNVNVTGHAYRRDKIVGELQQKLGDNWSAALID